MKNTFFSTVILALGMFGFQSCEELNIDPANLSNTDIVDGLKSALNVGTDSSVGILSKTDGYFKDELVKILLPDEAKVITDNIGKVPGGQLLLDQTIRAINRSAEDAATEAKPIFVNAITEITIEDGLGILKGNDDAATQYLNTKTYADLSTSFEPKINTSLSKELIPGISAQGSYASLVDKYNTVAKASFGILKEVKSNSLSAHTTNKALNGLFSKVAIEEGKIRNNINYRVTDILKKVFAEQD